MIVTSTIPVEEAEASTLVFTRSAMYSGFEPSAFAALSKISSELSLD